MPPPVVTALRPRPPRVAVDLDGLAWRTLPIEAVVRAGLAVGSELDRPAARILARELRRVEARDVALRALRRRDHTRASLEEHLVQRGTPCQLRRETVEAAERAGFVDDARFATARAEMLARRWAGNLLIEHDLERHGVPAAVIADAIGALEPERVRVQQALAVRGRSLRTSRYLAARGFSEDALEGLIADVMEEGLG